jgi:hypothetical protein
MLVLTVTRIIVFGRAGKLKGNTVGFRRENPAVKYRKSDVLTAGNMSVFFWAVTPCSLVSGYQRFGGT